MGHTPYGYRIENGIAVVDEDAAGKLRRLYTNYLSSMSLKTAAAEAGIRPASSTSSRQRTSTCAFSQISINSINCPDQRQRLLQNRFSVPIPAFHRLFPTVFLHHPKTAYNHDLYDSYDSKKPPGSLFLLLPFSQVLLSFLVVYLSL